MKAAADIRNRLAATASDDFPTRAVDLLAEMGYRSGRRLPGQSGDVADFLAQFPAENPGTQSEQAFRQNATSAHLLFQLTDAEIAAASAQGTLFDAESFAESNLRSFLFVAVELGNDRYPRGRYAAFTREINKRLSQPAVVLFRTASNLLTLAFVHRRPHKRDDGRDVLGSVSLVREIDPANPHRAHLGILADLSLGERLAWIEQNHKQRNFDGLLAAWLDALDTEALNKQFYRELQAWFDRAVQEATFPTNQIRHLKPEEHVMRLITRLLFVWFIKEKGLVANELFVEAQVRPLLKDYDRDRGNTYYRAVLQNLFFATLNTEIGQRRFSRRNEQDHRNPSLYRFQSEIADPALLQKLFERTPFINGGLFDCLDSFEAKARGGQRIDCFTDNVTDPKRREYGILSIPNRLFFDDAGLIPLLNRYKFTVEENTPIEKEVALDPELLGKVFENLLAANVDETRDTARRQTGSYYTPRAVVDYMVDEALVTTLADKAKPSLGDAKFWRDRLRYLLNFEDAFDDAEDLFNDNESEGIVRAISDLKVLDPAVGSGAFPVGVLHKLTLALHRLDRSNERWEALLKERAREKADAAFETREQRERDAELLEISDTFERYSSDFGRKLYLIRNSIFGIDVQPIAVQIAKLRFFISLAIEQEANDDPNDNYGIKPLPNLETRFVAANALLGLSKSDQLQMNLIDPALRGLQQQLGANQERQFHAAARSEKLRYRAEAKRLRTELGAELERLGMPAGDAEKVSAWDPDDQNAPAAGWFDAEYMFGMKDGFDTVIGNPPYVESRNSLLTKEAKEAYRSHVSVDWGDTLPLGSDLLVYFYARSARLLNEDGIGCFITQNAWLSTDYGKKFQDFSLGRFSFAKIIDTSHCTRQNYTGLSRRRALGEVSTF